MVVLTLAKRGHHPVVLPQNGHRTELRSLLAGDGRKCSDSSLALKRQKTFIEPASQHHGAVKVDEQVVGNGRLQFLVDHALCIQNAQCFDFMPDRLKAARRGYIHLPDLGGLRHALRDSPNGGWRNASFRGYADYMQTEAFEKALEGLIQLSIGEQVALMCAEAVPCRCHRSLVADALKIRGIVVEHIMSSKKRQVHKLTPWARVDGETITYPPSEDTKSNSCSL